MKTRTITRFLATLLLSMTATLALCAEPKTASTNNSVAQNAYSRIAQFVNNETLLVIRLDVDSLNSEQICSTYGEIFNGFLKERGFDKESINATNREFKKTLETIKQDVDTILALREFIGIREIFLIMQKQDESFRIVIPLPTSQRDSLVQKIAAVAPSLTASQISNGVCLTFNERLDADIYKNFKPESNTKLKNFYSTTAGATVQIYVSGLKIRKLLEVVAKKDEQLKEKLSQLPKEIAKGIDSFDTSFQYALISYDFNKMTYKSSYTFATAERAEDFRKGLERGVEYSIDQFEQKLDNTVKDAGKYNVTGVSKELFRGILLSMVPKRSDAVLSFDSTFQTKAIITHPCMFYLYGSSMASVALAKFNIGSLSKFSKELTGQGDSKTESTEDDLSAESDQTDSN